MFHPKQQLEPNCLQGQWPTTCCINLLLAHNCSAVPQHEAPSGIHSGCWCCCSRATQPFVHSSPGQYDRQLACGGTIAQHNSWQNPCILHTSLTTYGGPLHLPEVQKRLHLENLFDQKNSLRTSDQTKRAV